MSSEHVSSQASSHDDLRNQITEALMPIGAFNYDLARAAALKKADEILAVIQPELVRLRGLLDELKHRPDSWCSHQHIAMNRFAEVVYEKLTACAQRDEATEYARQMTAERDRLADAIDRVLELHRPASHGTTCVYCARLQSLGYDTDWPCDTVRALDQLAQQGEVRD